MSGRIELTEVDGYQGQRSCRIETAAAAYVYHLAGAGFASLRDRDGIEWIGYRPGGRSAGELRPLMTAVPSRFSFGFTESLDYGEIRQAVEKVEKGVCSQEDVLAS